MMKHDDVAGVTYRANRADGRQCDLRLLIAPEAATVADAWARLTVAYGAVDPGSLEIEIRHAGPTPHR